MNILDEFKTAKDAVEKAIEARRAILKRMVDAGLAAVVEDIDLEWSVYVVASPDVLKRIEYFEADGDSMQFVDTDGYQMDDLEWYQC